MFRCLIVESCVYLCTHASVCVCLKEVDRNGITVCSAVCKQGAAVKDGVDRVYSTGSFWSFSRAILVTYPERFGLSALLKGTLADSSPSRHRDSNQQHLLAQCS